VTRLSDRLRYSLVSSATNTKSGRDHGQGRANFEIDMAAIVDIALKHDQKRKVYRATITST
jgi:hypothetical protein